MGTSILMLCLLLPACATQETRVVHVPVYERAEASDELKAGVKNTEPPVFVEPVNVKKLVDLAGEELAQKILQTINASSCLTPEGEKHLKELTLDLTIQLCAWEAWGVIPETLYCKNLRTQKIAEMLKKSRAD